MPIRFQVDPDFYDHPKVTGMSDAAFSLWVRAGSFSAAKLTDGFISEDVLVYTLRSSEDVAEELARRGLWRRTKGGWRFHQWEGRNLTRKRVEDDKKSDAERKRMARQQRSDHQSGNGKDPEVTTTNVRPDSGQTPDGIPVDSQRNPDVSVSVSESVSPSLTSVGRESYVPARAKTPPPRRCLKHLEQPATGACRPCGDARQVRETWDERQVAEHRDTTTAIRACRLCDAEGRRWHPDGRRHGTVSQCDHRPVERQEPA